MDYDTYMGFEEQDAFEAQYADEMEVLNELAGGSTTKTQPLPDKKGGRRQLFEDDSAGQTSSRKHFLSDDDFDNDLIIDEDLLSYSPKRKRTRVDDGYRRCNLPTTLDCDHDERQIKKQIKLQDNGMSSPQMIEKILRYRETRYKGSSEEFLENVDQGTGIEPGHKLQLTKVLVVPPVHSDFVSTTSSDGQRCYMRIYPGEKLWKRVDSSSLVSELKSRQLLPQSVSEMRQEIQVMREQKVLKESCQITEEIRRRNIEESVVQMDSEGVNNVNCDIDSKENKENIEEDEGIYSRDETTKHVLWLDKYAPTQYTHLLSEESVNRSLLKWLKMWDHVVFGREIQPMKEAKPQQENRKEWKKFPFSHNIKDDLAEKRDEFNRPFWKVSLLHGPPGLGKTTLAHIIAKHAGYHVVEMNASDDRSAEAFRNKLDETTQMRSVLGHAERPNCLIIDEIDGAPQAAINILLSEINKKRKDESKKNSIKKRRNNGILLRPIICICNDLYVPALRQLRLHSLVLQFPPTQSARLASRLVQLCRIQNMQCDMTTLLTLCEKTDNDIRSCINTLQFAKSSGKQKLDIDTVKGLDIGQKDQHKSIFYVWHEIFQLPKSKRKMDKDAEAAKLSSGVIGKNLNSLSTRLYTICNLVSANGEYEKTLQGVYENYLKMKFKDHDMICINKSEEWLQFYDVLDQINRRLQDWSVLRYTPYLFVIFHMMFACVSVPRISFPTQKAENQKRTQRSKNLLQTMYSEMAPLVQCHVSAQAAVLDCIPYILAIMAPTLRPVNTQLFTPAEKKLVKDLVSTMLAYNLTYRQEKNEEGQYTYVLEPNVAEVSVFEGCQTHRKLTYATKQMIAKEVEMERMRRSERMMESRSSQPEKSVTVTNAGITKKSEIADKSVAPKPVPNHLQRLENSISQAALPKEKPVVDFFRRFKKIKSINKEGDDSNKKEKLEIKDPGVGNSHIWYKFNEGFSNAVRQTVYIRDFL